MYPRKRRCRSDKHSCRTVICGYGGSVVVLDFNLSSFPLSDNVWGKGGRGVGMSGRTRPTPPSPMRERIHYIVWGRFIRDSEGQGGLGNNYYE